MINRAARHGGTMRVSIPETTVFQLLPKRKAVVFALLLGLPTNPYNLASNMTIRLVR